MRRGVALALFAVIIVAIAAVLAAGDRRLVPIAIGLYVALVLTACVARRLFEPPEL